MTENTIPKVTERWLCLGCQFVLGYVEDKTIIRIKRKDLYVQCEGGKVTVTCPRCGKPNTLEDDIPDVQNIKG